MSRRRELLRALIQAQAGGFLASPPGFDGQPGLGLAGIHGIPRARLWDAVASESAPELEGDTVVFVVLEDGTIVVEGDQPDGSLEPLADALEESISPPYRAAAVRHEGPVWSAAAQAVETVELPGVDGDVVDLAVVEGQRELTIDGEQTIRALPALDRLVEEQGDVVAHAERVDGDLFTVDRFPL